MPPARAHADIDWGRDDGAGRRVNPDMGLSEMGDLIGWMRRVILEVGERLHCVTGCKRDMRRGQ